MAGTLFSLVGKVALDGMTRFHNDIKEGEKRVKDLRKTLGQFGADLTKMGATLSKNITAPLAAVGAVIGAAAIKTGNYANELLSLSEATGLSTDALQEYDHVARSAGASGEVFIAAVGKLSTNLGDIKDGTGSAAEAMDKLGISVINSDGSMRSMDELLPDIIGSLNKVEDVNIRNGIASDLFGKKLKDVAPILGMTREQLDATRKAAHDTGKVMGNDALKSADNFRLSVDNLKKDFGMLVMEIGSSVIPVLQNQVMPLLNDTVIPMFKSTANAVKGLAEWFGNLSPWVQKTIIVLGAAVAAVGPLLLIAGKFALSIKALLPVLATLGKTFTVIIPVIKTLAISIGGVASAIGALPLIIAGAVAAFGLLWLHTNKINKETEKFNTETAKMGERTGALNAQAAAARSAVEEYKKLKGTSRFDPSEMERLQAAHEDAVIALKNHSLEMQKKAPLDAAEVEATRDKIKTLNGVAVATKKQASMTDLQRKKEADAAEERKKIAAERRKELNDMIQVQQEATDKMTKSEEQLLNMQEVADIERAKKLGATEVQLDVIRERYWQENKKRMDEEVEKEKEKLKEIAEANAEWEYKILQQSGDKYKILDAEYNAAIASAEKEGRNVNLVHQYYANEYAKTVDEENKKRAEANAEWENKIAQQRIDAMADGIPKIKAIQAQELAELEQRRVKALADAVETGADALKIEESAAMERVEIEKKANKAIADSRRSLFSSIASFVTDSVSQLGSILNQFSANEEKRVSKEYSDKRKASEAHFDAEEKRIMETVKNEKERDKQLKALEEQRSAETTALQEAEEAKKLEIQKEQAGREKAIGIFTTIINTAQAIVRTLSDLGPIAGPIMAGVIGAMGVAQTAAIASTPEPFEAGAMIQGGRGGVHGLVGEGKQDELILPMETGVKQLANELAARQEAGGSTYNNYTVNVNVGNMIADDRGIKQLGRKIREVIIAEDRRTGVA